MQTDWPCWRINYFFHRFGADRLAAPQLVASCGGGAFEFFFLAFGFNKFRCLVKKLWLPRAAVTDIPW